MKRALITIAVVFLFSGQVYAQSEIKFKTAPQQRLDVRYRLFDTENMWTKLLLDTKTGRIWQVAFTIEESGLRAKWPVNTKVLVDEKNSQNGRFTLYPTDKDSPRREIRLGFPVAWTACDHFHGPVGGKPF